MVMAFATNIPPIQPHICVKGGLDAIAFYKKAFGAENAFHQLTDDGKRVLHASLSLFGGEIMLHDEFPEFGPDVLSPASRSGARSPASQVSSDSGGTSSGTR